MAAATAGLRGRPHRELLKWHRRLIALRRGGGLADGRLDAVQVGFDEAERWLVVERETVIVACNLSERGQRLPLPEGRAGEILLASEPEPKVGADAVELPRESVAILRRV